MPKYGNRFFGQCYTKIARVPNLLYTALAAWVSEILLFGPPWVRPAIQPGTSIRDLVRVTYVLVKYRTVQPHERV